jgi:proline racemase
MPFTRLFNVVSAHAEGEVGDVVTGGFLDLPAPTMYDKMLAFWSSPSRDQMRQLLLNEPRGRSAKCANLIVTPCDPTADAGFLIMEAEEYVPMSGSNAICVVTVLLETGMVKMVEPMTTVRLDTAAGLVVANAECAGGKCRNVEFENVPSFVFALDLEVDVPGLGRICVDIAYGGMMFALVDAAAVGMVLDDSDGNGAKLVSVGERIKKAVCETITPIHPENSSIRGVTNLVFTEPLSPDPQTPGGLTSRNATVVLPGRLDRSPCGTGTSARLATLHARSELAVGRPLRYLSYSGSQFTARISNTVKVGKYDAVVPVVKGRGFITSFQQVVLDAEDPYPFGFRVSDAWHSVQPSNLLERAKREGEAGASANADGES